MRIGWSGWSLDVPEGWAITDDPECLTLEPSRDSAVQVSAATKPAGAISFDELEELADSEGRDWGSASIVACGDFRGISYKYEQGGSVWRRWYLCNESTFVFITYNGTPKVSRHELSVVSAALDSLRVECEV